ncbi:MAG: putative membrane protein [Saprospiraceae bacterium]|jgi:uncharacterized membrane protein
MVKFIFVVYFLLSLVMILLVHTITSILALIAGALIFLTPKGTERHKKIGYTYILSMIILLVTSFWIFDLFGSFGVYHALSIVSFVTLAIALYFPIAGRKTKNWVEHHLLWMGYSYVGLVMAGGSHLFPILSDWPVVLRMFLFWGLPYIMGSILIFKNKGSAAKAAAGNIGQ